MKEGCLGVERRCVVLIECRMDKGGLTGGM